MTQACCLGGISDAIGGRGTAKVSDGAFVVSVPEKLDFVWVRLE